MSAATPITVIGIGNPYRHDDAAGLVVLDRLRQAYAADGRVKLIELDGEPVRLIQAWEGSTTVLIVDAVRSLQPPGTIHHFDAEGLTGAAGEGVALGGGHLLGLGEAVDLARALGQMPPRLEVIGIEGADFELGLGISPSVTEACEQAALQLIERIDHALAGCGAPTPGA